MRATTGERAGERKVNCAACVKMITPNCCRDAPIDFGVNGAIDGFLARMTSCLVLDERHMYGIKVVTLRASELRMPKKTPPSDPKADALRGHGCLHPHAGRVRDPLFAAVDFFDARDLVQVKYEMVRRVAVDGQPVSQAAAAFGFSRPSFYEAQAAVGRGGLPALLPKKRGPRRAHKLGAEVLDFLRQLLAEHPTLRPSELAERVLARFGIQAHPRSIERALAREEKKR